MKTFKFASLRGSDFIVSGATVQEAWKNLVEREKDNGSIWKTSCKYRNAHAVKLGGFTFMDESNPSAGAYKDITV